MKLLELFDKTSALKFTLNEPKKLTAVAQIGDQKYEFYAGLNQKTWWVAFEIMGGQHIPYGLSKTGKAEEVMACAIRFMTQLIKLKQPDSIVFSAVKNYQSASPGVPNASRADLYLRILKRFAPSGYETTVKDSHSERMFVLNKTKD